MSVPMSVEIREFRRSDYDSVLALWKTASGIVLRAVDAREPLTAYLSHNRGLSFVAIANKTIVGAVLCGTDGRRGYLQHLAVAAGYRRKGIGRKLARSCIDALAARGIDKCHLMVTAQNQDAIEFWRSLGWIQRQDILLMSHVAPGKEGV
jgi:N-acetylglutamate synthase